MPEGSFLALLHMEARGYDLVLHSCLSNATNEYSIMYMI